MKSFYRREHKAPPMVESERRDNMTHMEFIKNNFTILAETANAIFFDAYGENVAEINGQPFNCDSVEEFHELVEFWGDETFEE